MALTYREWFRRILRTPWARQGAGEKLVGACGLLLDQTMETVHQSVRAAWVGDTVGPAFDALSVAASELSLPRYPRESWDQHHARTQRAWEDWPYAGHETSIAFQLEDAGFSGVNFYYAADWPTAGRADWWSQFWALFPAGTHTVTASAPIVGTFTVGDGTIVGPVGLEPTDLQAMRSIIKKFKPAHYICAGIIFEISGWTVGTGHTVGDVGLVVGGENAIVGVT